MECLHAILEWVYQIAVLIENLFKAINRPILRGYVLFELQEALQLSVQEREVIRADVC